VLVYFDLKEREEQVVVEEIDGYGLSADQKKVLVNQGTTLAILDLKPKQKIEKKLRTAELETLVDPKAEWRQMFTDAWRIVRDYFYDPGMHGVKWEAVKAQYSRLLDDCVTRWDVNFVIGEMIAELNASHTYRGGGDIQSAIDRKVGLLGVDWSLENGAYRIKHIVSGGDWDISVRSPLREPGVAVREGDYVLAVNGMPILTERDPWAAFQGLAEQTVVLTVNDKPTLEGARKVLVNTLASEGELRQLEWIEGLRKRVDEATGGRVGYIYVPSTGIDGQNELVRQFRAQFDKEALIIDERFNSGGQIPDRFVELLNRKPLSFWAVRDGQDWQWPPVGHFGPKVMLINGWSGSGGDAFPYYFRESGLGPLIGTRTWGGLIGLSGNPQLIDGGGINVPTFRMYGTDGVWFPEGHGVEPDIEVVNDPGEMAKGRDPQLERAVQEVLRLLKEKPGVSPKRPRYEDRSNGMRPS
jgi:tricorn protease